MDDLISRQKAIDIFHVYAPGIPWKKLDKIFSAIPSAQPEQPDIIACGDCKHWIYHDRRCGFWNHGVKPLDWCSYAERKEGEADV